MSHENLKQRTKLFALAVIRLVKMLPDDKIGRTLGTQLLRSATSVAANYRAANRARSTADFIAKMGIVEEEADESSFWLDMLTETGTANPAQTQPLIQEASELTAIAVTSIITARKRPSAKTATRVSAPRSPLPVPRS
jgi:four helix bundle protein